MKNRTATLALMLPLLFAAVALAGDRDIDERRDVDGDAVINVDNLAGEIIIVGWDKNEVHIKGTLDKKAEKLEIDGGGDSLDIKVKYPRKKNQNIKKGSYLEIRVPEGCELEMEGVSCDMEVSDFHGLLEAVTVSGDMKIEGGMRGLETSTVSGDVVIDSETETVEIETVSGYIEVRGVKRSLEISLVSGEAEVWADELMDFSFNCVSGDLTARATPARGADWELECHSGDLTLELPDDVDAEFDIELFSGDLDNDFGPEAKRTSKFAPGKELRFTAGDGGADVEISTFSGDVRLVKR